MELIDAKAFIDTISELFSEDTSIVLSSTDEYLYYRPSKRIDLKIKPGDPILEGTITHKALVRKHKISEYMDRDFFGVPYYGMAVPYKLNGETKGCITAVFPILTSAMTVVTVKKDDGWTPIPFSEIIYIEAKERKTYVIGKQNNGTHKNTLNDFDFILPKESFIRCHRSYIVNVEYIKEIYSDTHSTFLLQMIDGTIIPVSQSHASYFRKLLGF